MPGAAGLGLVPPPSAALVPGAVLADPAWHAEVLAARVSRQGTADRRVLATVWWYSLSAVLLTPPLAGLATGSPLSARLDDTSLYLLTGGRPVAAASSAAFAGPECSAVDGSGGGLPVGRPGSLPYGVGQELRTALGAVVAAIAEAGGARERPLWAIAADSIAGRLLALGQALGTVPEVTALAGPLGAAVGPPLPGPRYVDVAGARFVHRVSCCLLYRVPAEQMCLSCPRRPPVERNVLLEDAATRR